MLNICFGDSEAGALRTALPKEEVTFSYRALELGAIHPDFFESARKDWIDKSFSICSKRERKKIWEQEKERVAKIIEAARSEKELRIWYATSPCSICGYYKTVDMLQVIDCRIYVVEMPDSVGDRKPPYQDSWGAVCPEQMAGCLSYQRELSQDERKEISQKWKALEQDDSGLRLNIDGTVKNVPENYLDDEILSYAPTDNPFRLGFLVGNVLGKSIHAVSDFFIASRVEALINSGKIIVVERAKKTRDYYYKTILRVAAE